MARCRINPPLIRRALLAAVLLMLAGRLWGAPPPVPQAPADGLYDDTRVLNDEQRARAVKSITAARAAGVNLFVAVYSFIVGETIEQRAERLKAEWCPDGSGLLVVADTSTNQCTYLSHVAETEWLNTVELQGIFTDASTTAAAAEGTSADKVTVVIETLGPRLSQAMDRQRELRQRAVDPRVWWVFGGVTTGSLVLVGGLLWLRRTFGARRRAASVQALYFPTVSVAERFGGPFGGGVIAEVSFGPAGEQKPAVRQADAQAPLAAS